MSRNVHQRGDVVRTAGFDAGADGALAHAAEGLAQHDRAGRRAIDVEVAGADALLPALLLAVVEAFEARGQAVAGGVHQVDRFVAGRGLPSRRARGPKNSVQCVTLPGCTPHFTPGLTRCGLPSTCSRGMTAHSSPGSSSLSAASRARRTAGGSAGRSSSAAPRRSRRARLSTASHSVLAELGVVVDLALRESSSDVAEHFCPLWLNAEWSTFLIAWSRSASAVTIVAFLPPVSAKRCIVGLWASIVGGGLGAAGEDHRIDAVVRHELLADACRRCRGRTAARSAARRLARSTRHSL